MKLWLGLDLNTFLYKLGAYGKDKNKGVEGVTVARLLMFGEEREILDEFPKYFLDYREKTTDICNIFLYKKGMYTHALI